MADTQVVQADPVVVSLQDLITGEGQSLINQTSKSGLLTYQYSFYRGCLF